MPAGKLQRSVVQAKPSSHWVLEVHNGGTSGRASIAASISRRASGAAPTDIPPIPPAPLMPPTPLVPPAPPVLPPEPKSVMNEQLVTRKPIANVQRIELLIRLLFTACT